jgi:hypothetical protein
MAVMVMARSASADPSDENPWFYRGVKYQFDGKGVFPDGRTLIVFRANYEDFFGRYFVFAEAGYGLHLPPIPWATLCAIKMTSGALLALFFKIPVWMKT